MAFYRFTDYYELVSSQEKTVTQEFIIQVFRTLIDLNKKGFRDRLMKQSNGYVYTINVKFDPAKKLVKGIFILNNTNILPEVGKITEEKLRPMEAGEDEGVAFKTHFILSYNEEKEVLFSIERNKFGCSDTTILNYIRFINSHFVEKPIKLNFVEILVDDLHTFKDRIGKPRKFYLSFAPYYCILTYRI